MDTCCSNRRKARWFAAVLCLLVSVAVVAWGMGYKLSLYRASTLFHKIPEAKLLNSCSGDKDQGARLQSSTLKQQTAPASWLACAPLRLAAAIPTAMQPTSFRAKPFAIHWVSMFRRPPPSNCA